MGRKPQLQPPMLPYLGPFLTDLAFIEQGNSNLLPGTEVRPRSSPVIRRAWAVGMGGSQRYKTRLHSPRALPYGGRRGDELRACSSSTFTSVACCRRWCATFSSTSSFLTALTRPSLCSRP